MACSVLILWLILKKFTPLKNIYISCRPMWWTFIDATSIIFNNSEETRHETTITIIINVLLVCLFFNFLKDYPVSLLNRAIMVSEFMEPVYLPFVSVLSRYEWKLQVNKTQLSRHTLWYSDLVQSLRAEELVGPQAVTSRIQSWSASLSWERR